MKTKRGAINEAFFVVSTFILLIILTVVFFLGISWIKTSDYFSGDNENEINVIRTVSCEGDIQDVLFKILNTEVVIDGSSKKVKDAIEDSTLTVDLFREESSEYFLDAFPDSKSESIKSWGVGIYNLNNVLQGESAFGWFKNGGVVCDKEGIISSEILIGEKKIVGCLTKVFCERIK